MMQESLQNSCVSLVAVWWLQPRGENSDSAGTLQSFIQGKFLVEMTDILRLVNDEDRRTLRVFSQLSKNDIDGVWTAISSYIKRQMTLQKGVHLSGLGTFTFSKQDLDIGNKPTKILQPTFIVAGKLVHSLGLKQTRPLAAATHLPVVQLNFVAVSQEIPFSRDEVEGCYRETLLLLFRALDSEKKLSLFFNGIGVLSFKSNKVQMKFNRDFMNAMEGTGRQLTGLKTRAGSSVSSLPDGLSKPQRPPTADPVILPTVCFPQLDNKAGDKDGEGLSPTLKYKNAGEVPQQREPKSNQTLQPAKLKAVSLTKELNPNPPVESTNKPTMSNSPQMAPAEVKDHLENVSCLGNTHVGQELCYLCTQRERRNVPVYLREQQQAEEKAQEKLLLLNEQLRDKHQMEQERVKLTEQRDHAKQVAAFNMQMSQKKEKISCPIIPNTFIFPARPLTPPRRIQQHCYMNNLLSQIETQQKHKAIEQHNRLLMEHLDQVQLIQETALQRAQLLQQKQEKTKYYKKALDIQLFQVNINTATQRKKEELQNRKLQLEKEREMLRHNKMELILDRISFFEKKRNISKSLEDEWGHSVTLKHEREEEERRFLRSAGQLLVDKLTEYRRCCQCKRKTSNCGETNIWKDSRHLAGSQFMI
ncbi:coiled-coil domain-containing protein 81-like isoform X2 [Melanotaenia boesemani]|uniref:coiled-coil domain-containing protein 81-like isoform X2 n=1 Tax=Melanotaenia boesemani TaxID=1250792 RepID=UPI001C040040|nr:coiled-coil domain-containing protein 81-like isoform X2 [Melanotaenia boesemani]